MSHAPIDADVLVVGGGIVGLSLAAALKQALTKGFKVELWDPTLGRRSPRQRVSAIAAGSRHMLETLGVWSEIDADAQPVRGMEITDSKLHDSIRPAFLRFESGETRAGPLAHMIRNADLEEVLERRASSLGVNLRSDLATETSSSEVAAVTMTSTGRSSRSLLVVAADGARSPLREAAGIDCVSWSYAEQAIVCTIEHEREHEGRARQHFLPEGVFAILPLVGRRSSIVWTAPVRLADRLLRLGFDEFHDEIERRFGLELGWIKVIDAPLRFDLGLTLARSLVSRRLALVGDAAHSIHPLAGQGLNLGLRDVAALSEIIVGSARLGLDPGANEPLRRYEKMRRFDAMAMALMTDVLDRVFSWEGPARLARDLGLALTNGSPALKASLMSEAAGVTASPPRLFRGKCL